MPTREEEMVLMWFRSTAFLRLFSQVVLILFILSVVSFFFFIKFCYFDISLCFI